MALALLNWEFVHWPTEPRLCDLREADTPPAGPPPARANAPAPAAAVAAAAPVRGGEHAARDVALEKRERDVRQRELELAGQRRVLAEEYRLMHARRESAPPAASVVAPANSRLRPQVAGAGLTRFDAVRADTFWARLKRFMLGVSASQES